MARSGASGNIKHAIRHVDGGVDEIDGDLIDITFTPTTYTPDASPPEANDVDDLAAHLNGIDQYLSNVVQADSFAFAYDITTQSIVTANVFQDVTFGFSPVINGWVHTPGTSEFTADADSTHYIVITGTIQKTGGGNLTAAIRMILNGTEVPGSHFGIDLTSNNTAFTISRTLMVEVLEDDIVEIQVAGNSDRVQLKTGPNPGTATVTPSITLTMQRVT